MAIVQVQTISATGSGTGLTVSLPGPVATGNRIIVVGAAHATGAITGAIGMDNLGNNYYLDFDTFASASDFKRIDIFSTPITLPGTCTLTYSISGGSALGISLIVYEYSGLSDGTFPGGGGQPAQLGAAFVDHGAAEGSAPFPPLTLAFAFDIPPLAAFYGNQLSLLGIVGAYDQSLTGSVELYTAAQNSVLVPFPSFPILDVAVGVIVLYVGSSIVGVLDCSITIVGIDCGAVPMGQVGVPYFYQFPPGPGLPPYLYSIAAGSLPPGLTLDSVTGIASGTPTVAGIFNFTVSITNSTCNVGSQSQCIIVTTIYPAPPG